MSEWISLILVIAICLFASRYVYLRSIDEAAIKAAREGDSTDETKLSKMKIGNDCWLEINGQPVAKFYKESHVDYLITLSNKQGE